MIDQRLQTAMRRRAAHIIRWLADEAPYAESDRFHMQVHSPERAYFHLGYLHALRHLLQIEEQYARTAPIRGARRHYVRSANDGRRYQADGRMGEQSDQAI
jgi:hypothetical protein